MWRIVNIMLLHFDTEMKLNELSDRKCLRFTNKNPPEELFDKINLKFKFVVNIFAKLIE